ncbi:IclR family transcriptional regulator [Nocardia beijingensis]|uniref:IclR family transcriptional regulator n=1 Tax=Nocardia beijingensis TaxID=95162 RepID=UPI000A07DAAB|nr:helix-turn-helix domain-containing protein [Nocardia beijingensis]
MATPASQSTDRVVDILETLAAANGPMSIAEVASAMGVHRSIVYRAVQTLVNRRLVRRESDGRYALGIGLMLLATSVSQDFQEIVNAELAALADRAGASVMFVVDSGDRVECLLTAEPRNAEVHLAMRFGAFGRRRVAPESVAALAITIGRPAEAGETAELIQARRRGYVEGASTRWPGITLLAAPVYTAPGYANASVAVLYSAGSPANDPKDVLRTAATLSEYFVHARVSLPFSPGPQSGIEPALG